MSEQSLVDYNIFIMLVVPTVTRHDERQFSRFSTSIIIIINPRRMHESYSSTFGQ